MEYFGLKLQTLRKKASMSQMELAELLGVSRQAISKWERSEALPDLYNAKKIAEVFGITIDDLMDIEIKSIDKTKEKTNKTALAFLLVPGILVAFGLVLSFTGLFVDGAVVVNFNVLMLIAILYLLIYSLAYYNLQIGRFTTKYKTVILVLNFLLLFIYTILVIQSLDSGGLGYIFLFIVLLAIITLGIIGGFMYNPELQPNRVEYFREKHKGLRKAYKSVIFILVGFVVILGGYFLLTKSVQVHSRISYELDLVRDNLGATYDANIRAYNDDEMNLFISCEQENFKYSDVLRIVIYVNDSIIHDSDLRTDEFEINHNEDKYTIDYDFEYSFNTIESIDDVSEINIYLYVNDDVRIITSTNISEFNGYKYIRVPVWQ